MTTLLQINNLLQNCLDKLPSNSIFGGRGGASIINALVSRKEETHSLFSVDMKRLLNFNAKHIQVEIWKLWIVATLLENKAVSLPYGHSFEQVVKDAVYHSLSYCYGNPIKLTQDLIIYPFGLVTLKALKLLDGIPFYSLVEFIVLFMRDCEYFLTRYDPSFHGNPTIKASVLHSTLRFMQLAEEKKIFTYKAIQLQEYIASFEYDKINSNPADNYILGYLSGISVVKRKWNDKELSYLGTIAFLYDLPELFSGVFRSVNFDNIKIDNLVGIGLGMLSNSINGNEL